MNGLPGFANSRRTMRAPLNPMDKCTIVSIMPKPLDETKPTISPGRFMLKAGSYENPSILVIGSSSWWREISEEEPLLEIPDGSVVVASAVVTDFCNGLLCCNMSDSMPGLFYLPGSLTVKLIKEHHQSDLDRANIKQKNWFRELVKEADKLWARTNGNPISITEDMRIAAKELNLLSKDWMREHQMMDNVRCKACGTLRNPEFPMCPNCRAIDNPELATKLGIKFASV